MLDFVEVARGRDHLVAARADLPDELLAEAGGGSGHEPYEG